MVTLTAFDLYRGVFGLLAAGGVMFAPLWLWALTLPVPDRRPAPPPVDPDELTARLDALDLAATRVRVAVAASLRHSPSPTPRSTTRDDHPGHLPRDPGRAARRARPLPG